MVFEYFKEKVEKFVAEALINVMLYMFWIRVKCYIYMAYLKHYLSRPGKVILR